MKRPLLIVLAAIAILGGGRCLLLLVASAQETRVATENGDTNGDGKRDLSDAIYLLRWLFLDGTEPVALAGTAGLEDRVKSLEDQVVQG